MNNTSHPLRPKPDHPVDPTTSWVIHEVDKAAKQLGFPVLLVGAMARIILLENVYGLPAGRATTDVDFAFALENWEQFLAIKTYLVKHSNCEVAARVTQRLFMTLPSREHKYQVDLIPFGGIEIRKNTIAWPPDTSVLMNVAGYSDALAASVLVELSPELIINIASLPGIAILKLFAWSDRGYEDRRDAIDFADLLKCYNEAGQGERIYVEATEALEKVDYDVELAGAWLLGKDAAAMASPQTKSELEDLLNGTKVRRLTEDMARAKPRKEDGLEYSRRLLNQFTFGFTA